MRRSGALTLGAVLMLGGATGGWGDELSGSVGAGGPSSGGFSWPALPDEWNWSDLPVRLSASESVSYNSNILSLPIGMSATNGLPQGDFTSTSSYGLSTKANWYGQQFFFDGTFGVIRYLHETGFDSNVYSFSPGVNWTLTSRCTGTLVGLFTKSPSTITEIVGTGINYATETSLNETGKCAISNGYSVVFNSSASRTNNSNPLDALNNANVEMISAGIEYAKGNGDLTLLATKSDTNYASRGAALNALGLANTVVFHNFNLSYTRQINSNLSVIGQLGLVGVTNAFTLGLPKTLLPTYSLEASWAITPKVSLAASATRTVAAPTTLIGNAEVSYYTDLSLTYQATPKVTFSATGSAGYSSVAFTPAAAGTMTALVPFLTTTNYYGLTAGVRYAMTPFISAALSASYTERVSEHVITPQDLITVSLDYKPY
jgi:hypothetical protein